MALTSNLAAYWQLSESTGNRIDSAGDDLHLTSNNSVASAAGVVGDAAKFTRSSSMYLSHADANELDLNDTSSASAWSIAVFIAVIEVVSIAVFVCIAPIAFCNALHAAYNTTRYSASSGKFAIVDTADASTVGYPI